MTGFLDLPKRLRERIYRDALIRDSSTTLKDYVGDCKERSQGFLSRDSSAPPLLKVNAKITREAAPIYYGGNRFRLDDLGALSYVFSGVPLRFIHMIEHVTVVYKGSGGLEPRQTLDRIKNFTHARKVTVIIEEEDLAARELLKSTLVQWHPVIGLSDQLKLWALYAKGTRALAGLAETSRVCLKVRSGDSGVTRKFSTAAIAPYTVKHSESERAGIFRLLDLPPEIRTMIYQKVLVFPGKIYPQRYDVVRMPTSVAAGLKYSKRKSSSHLSALLDAAPKSALEILGVNRQICHEAFGIFYFENDFAFSSPTSLLAFIGSLPVRRLMHLRKVTVFEYMTGERNSQTLDVTLPAMKMLPALEQLHVLLPINSPHRVPDRFPGAAGLFQLRGLKSIYVQDLDTEHVLKVCRKGGDAWKNAKKQLNVMRHFNHGLALAQQGIVVASLYQDTQWDDKPVFPILQGSSCSAELGCSCEEVAYDDARVQEVVDTDD